MVFKNFFFHLLPCKLKNENAIISKRQNLHLTAFFQNPCFNSNAIKVDQLLDQRRVLYGQSLQLPETDKSEARKRFENFDFRNRTAKITHFGAINSSNKKITKMLMIF